MTREQIMAEYKVDSNGIIRNPGKFEGEMLYVPFYWEAFLDGMADDDGEYLTFKVSDDDRLMFPELAKIKKVVLRQRDDGFVCEC